MALDQLGQEHPDPVEPESPPEDRDEKGTAGDLPSLVHARWGAIHSRRAPTPCGGGVSLDALQDRPVLDEDAAALVGSPHAVDVVGILGEPVAVLLVRRETREVD
jgi:hypothetical protein